MYTKIFASLYQGTLRGRAREILVFTCLLTHADRCGHVDIHFQVIADEVGLSESEVRLACAELEKPDPQSRSPEEQGRRLVRLDDHRDWGWRIVNYVKYREIRNEDDRREANRRYQQASRERRRKLAHVRRRKHMSAMSAHADADADAKGGKNPLNGAQTIVYDRELQRVQKSMDALRSSHESHQSWSDDDRAKYAKLKAERTRIRGLLGLTT